MSLTKRNWILACVAITAVSRSIFVEWTTTGRYTPPSLQGSIQSRNVTSQQEFLSEEAAVAAGAGAERHETPYEQCMRQLEPEFDPQTDIYLHWGKQRSKTLSLRDAMKANDTTIYFLHQRKAGGTTIRQLLFNMAKEALGREEALKRVWIPCHAPKKCVLFEMPLYEKNYLGHIKVAGAHMSFHTPFARSGYEDQVLITNFREPVSRIKSCMLFRYIRRVRAVFGAENYTHADGEKLVLTQKDEFQSTCMQEPLRILSPLDPDKEPLSRHDRHKICCMVRNNFHVIQTPPPTYMDESNSTLIEREIMAWMGDHKLNAAQKHVLSERLTTNLDNFMEHIRMHPMVQAEIALYNCVTNREYTPEV